MNRLYIAAAALLCVAGCATPGPSAETPASVAKSGSSSAEAEQICRYERKTGSTIRTKVCRTPAEMEALQEKSRDVLNEMDKSSTAASGQ